MSLENTFVCSNCGTETESGKKCQKCNPTQKFDNLARQQSPLDLNEALKNPDNQFGKYVLIKELGYGGMGTVYKAWQKDLGRYVALKFLSGNVRDEELNRFLREAQLSAKLSHPNIAQVYDVNIESSRPYIAMQYIDGKTLDSLKETPLNDKVKILEEASRAIDYAHSQGIIHRDLKPSNIMISSTGTVYVLDFGLAKTVAKGQTVTMSGVVMGTPSYMSPEQALGAQVDVKSDVYSLGAILYELITNQPPFHEETTLGTLNQVISEEPKKIHILVPKCPRDIETICLKALNKEPDRRYQSAKQFADDLSRFLAGEPVLAKPPSLTYKLLIKIRKQRTLFIAISISLIVLGAALILILSQEHSQKISEEQKKDRIKQYILEAKEAIQSEDWLKAKEKVDKTLELDQNDDQAKTLLVTIKPKMELLFAVKDLPQGARDVIEKARKLVEVKKKEDFNYKEWNGILGEAIIYLSIRKESWTIHFLMGEVYKEYYEIDNAINDYTKAINLSPENKLVYLARAEAYIIKMFQEYWWLKEFGLPQNDLLEKADKDLTKADGITLKTEDIEYISILAKIAKGGGDSVLKLFNAKGIKTAMLKAGFLLFLGRFADCNDECTNIIKSFPAYMPAYYFRSSARIALKDYKGAIDDCVIASTLKEDLFELYLQSGIVLYRHNNYPEAITHFTSAIGNNNQSEVGFAYKGLALFKKGDYKNALTDLNKAVGKNILLEKSLNPIIEVIRDKLKKP